MLEDFFFFREHARYANLQIHGKRDEYVFGNFHAGQDGNLRKKRGVRSLRLREDDRRDNQHVLSVQRNFHHKFAESGGG